jgi:peptide deformylase
MFLRITKHGEPILKGKAEAVDFSAAGPDLARLLRDMWRTMYASKGVGLAAPQVGISMRLAVIDVRPGGKSERIVLINPEVLSVGGDVSEEEGCLSLPGLYANVPRHSRVRVRAFDERGRPWERTATGLLARAFQHEIDHLEGRLFIDRLGIVDRLKAAVLVQELRKNWK